MNELLQFRLWLESLDFSTWPTDAETLDSWLDLRDAFEFEREWEHVVRQLQNLELEFPVQADEQPVLEDIQKTAFLAAIRVTGSNELAAYVSDDFDVLARATRLGFNDRWLNTLRLRYEQGRFPRGTL